MLHKFIRGKAVTLVPENDFECTVRDAMELAKESGETHYIYLILNGDLSISTTDEGEWLAEITPDGFIKVRTV